MCGSCVLECLAPSVWGLMLFQHHLMLCIFTLHHRLLLPLFTIIRVIFCHHLLMPLFTITYCYHFSPSPNAALCHQLLLPFSPLPSATIHHYLLLLFELIHTWVSKRRKKIWRFLWGYFLQITFSSDKLKWKKLNSSI